VRGDRVSDGIAPQVRHWMALSSGWSMSSQVDDEQLEQGVVLKERWLDLCYMCDRIVESVKTQEGKTEG
jgi:hypothetical protein